MRDDGADVFFGHALRLQELADVQAVLIRVLLVVDIVEITDGLPVLLVGAEVVCHRAHGSADRRRMREEMLLRRVLCQYLSCLFQCQFAHEKTSICKLLYFLL